MFIEKIRGGVQCQTCKNFAITYIQHLHDLHADDPEWFFESFDGSENGLYYCKTCSYGDYISDSEVMSYLFDGIIPTDENGTNIEFKNKYYLIDLERSIGRGVIYYWNPNCHGYTEDIEHAGIFTKEVAENVCSNDRDHFTLMISEDSVDKIRKMYFEK